MMNIEIKKGEGRMETKRQSYWWWFDSHNSPNCSPWLESTLAELNQKTKAMLKLIDEDADSFAQRAEMYYKKRPELISLVEDFYRAHRSLAERYDLLRTDHSGRVRSPVQNSFWHFPKGGCENVISSVKSYHSECFAEEAYSSEESAESEIDDPELVDDVQIDQDGSDKENSFSDGSSFDELMNLREELERLQEENKIQRDQIELKDREIEELMARLYGNIDELKNLRKEMETTAFALKEQSSEIMMSKYEIERKELARKEEQAKCELMKKVREEVQIENMNLRNALAQKDEEKREVIRQLSMAIEMLREDNRFLKKSTTKDARKNWTRATNPEIQIFKGVDLEKLFGFWSKYHTSVVPL